MSVSRKRASPDRPARQVRIPAKDSDICRTRDAAVAAARRGWHVFPCRPGDKRPVVQGWEQKAIADPARVTAHWPGDRHNVGIACGPSGLVVLDLDGSGHAELEGEWRELPGVRDGRDVLAQLAEWAAQPWPETFTVLTPGGGWHCYFTAPAGAEIRNSASRLGPLVDVRGRGGYVIGPGSVVAGRPYQVTDDRAPVPLPGWLSRLARPGPARPAQPGGGWAAPASPDARVRGLLAHVAAGTPGDRNGRLYWAACRAGELAAAGRIDKETIMDQLVSAALAAGLTGGEREARRTVASGMRTGAGQ